MRIVIAPDSFKGTLTAGEAAAHLAAGWRAERPRDELVLLPMADGGEGTLDAVAGALPIAAWHRVPRCTGPDGRRVAGRFLLLPGGVATVELAVTSGLPLMAEPDPLRATTRGLGEVIAAALDAGAGEMVIAVGGSASTDGGAGALSALGLGLYDENDKQLDDGGGALANLARLDRGELRAPPAAGVRILTDVPHPLLGVRGAAAVFGPQKGASAREVALLEAALARFAAVVGGDPTMPGAGAAGGAAFGFATVWGARIVPGAAVIADLIGLDDALAGADLVITGEGMFDETSRRGKVVAEVAERARTPVVVVCGSARAPAWPPITGVVALAQLAGSVEAATASPAHWLRTAARRLARAAASGIS